MIVVRIVVRMVGGLGNQMFQYAAGLSLSARLNEELFLDLREFKDYKLFGFGLDGFAITGRLANTYELQKWPEFLRRPGRIASILNIPFRWYSEKSYAYDKQWSNIKGNKLIDGYFQSAKYFNDVAEEVRKQFKPRQYIGDENIITEKLINAGDSVMIHVRRGDYVTNKKTLEKHGVCSLKYYESSIDIIKNKVNNPRFFVFSNDMDWAKTNLDLGEDVVFVTQNAGSPTIDIYLMSKCKCHIIANSSFSWWGAWLSGVSKLTISPDPWFNLATYDTYDLIPNDWLKVDKA